MAEIADLPTEFLLPDDFGACVAEPLAYGDMKRWHQMMTEVRARHPLSKSHYAAFDPFWTVSRIEDIRAIGSDNSNFLNGPLGLVSKATPSLGEDQGFRSIVSMNPPEHQTYRRLVQLWFMSKNVKTLDHSIRQIACKLIGRFIDGPREVDVVDAITVHFPLLVLMSILGIPEEEEPMMLRMTQQYFGTNDPEMARLGVGNATEIQAGYEAVVKEVSDCMLKVNADRLVNPTDDLATVLAHATIDGKPLPQAELLGYYFALVTAGHDTTSSSLAGGIWALAERPAVLRQVREDLSLAPTLADECVRWTSPVGQFVRIAAGDIEYKGRQIRKGDQVVLCYPSGNRDDECFEDPFAFRPERKPNPHVGFGYGPHVCVGMHLARLELQIFFQEFLPRIMEMELAGTPRTMRSNLVNGPTRLPLRFTPA